RSIISFPMAASIPFRSRRLHEPGELEALAALEQLPPGLRLLAQAVNLDEALGGGLVVAAALLVGRELLAVKAVIALPAHDGGLALEQLDADDAAHEPLVTLDEGE